MRAVGLASKVFELGESKIDPRILNVTVGLQRIPRFLRWAKDPVLRNVIYCPPSPGRHCESGDEMAGQNGGVFSHLRL
jgi:hypothetical protein